MKRLALLATVVLLLALSVSAAPRPAQIDHVLLFEQAGQLAAYVDVNARTDLDEVTITVMVPELGVSRTSGPFDVNAGQDDTRVLVVDLYGAPQGTYYARIDVSNDEARRVVWRPFTIE